MKRAEVSLTSAVTKAIVADCSYLLFVYPFLFRTEAFNAHVRAFDAARWQAGRHKPEVWQKDKFPAADMMTYVANYLNPPDTANATARLWKMNWALRDVFGLSGRAQWRLMLRRKQIPFVFGRPSTEGEKETAGSFAFKLALFQVGVGFLTVCVTPDSDKIDDWLDFAHYFRFVNRKSDVEISAGDINASAETQPAERLSYPELVGGETKLTFNDLLVTLLNTGSLKNKNGSPADEKSVRTKDKSDEDESGGNGAEWWREVFVPEQVLPFATLFMDNAAESEDLLLAHKLQNFFHSAQTIIPAAADLTADHPSLLPYADRQWFIFSLDGGAFLAANAPDNAFFRGTLPGHLRDHYFLLYLLTLHQRFFLMSLQQRITEEWLRAETDADRFEAFENIRRAFLEFTARSIFPQIMQREHHHRCYLKWQNVFQIEDLYREVRREIREMYEYSLFKLTEREERSARRIESLVAVLGLPALLFGFLGVNILGWTNNDGLKATTVLVLGFVFALLGAGLIWLLQRVRN